MHFQYDIPLGKGSLTRCRDRCIGRMHSRYVRPSGESSPRV